VLTIFVSLIYILSSTRRLLQGKEKLIPLPFIQRQEKLIPPHFIQGKEKFIPLPFIQRQEKLIPPHFNQRQEKLIPPYCIQQTKRPDLYPAFNQRRDLREET
jgi:hypothetical protein